MFPQYASVIRGLENTRNMFPQYASVIRGLEDTRNMSRMIKVNYVIFINDGN